MLDEHYLHKLAGGDIEDSYLGDVARHTKQRITIASLGPRKTVVIVRCLGGSLGFFMLKPANDLDGAVFLQHASTYNRLAVYQSARAQSYHRVTRT